MCHHDGVGYIEIEVVTHAKENVILYNFVMFLSELDNNK